MAVWDFCQQQGTVWREARGYDSWLALICSSLLIGRCCTAVENSWAGPNRWNFRLWLEGYRHTRSIWIFVALTRATVFKQKSSRSQGRDGRVCQKPDGRDDVDKEQVSPHYHRDAKCWAPRCCLIFPFHPSSEFPFPTVAPTPTPPRTKHKLVVEGKTLTFRCGKKIASKRGKV